MARSIRIEQLAAAWAIAGGVIVLLIMLVTSVNVAAFALDKALRPFDGSVPGLAGYEDFVALAMSAAAPMFLPWCQHKRSHVRVELLSNRLTQTTTRMLDRFWLLCLTVTCLLLAGAMIWGTFETHADHVLSPVLGWPQWPFYLPGIVSLLLWAIIAGRQATAGNPFA